MIEINRSFAERGVNKIELDIKSEPMGSEDVKKGGQSQGSSLAPSNMEVPPQGWIGAYQDNYVRMTIRLTVLRQKLKLPRVSVLSWLCMKQFRKCGIV